MNLGAIAVQPVKRACGGEVFDRPLVHRLGIHPFGEVVQALERAVRLAFGDHGRHGGFADIPHGCERIAHGRLFALTFHRKAHDAAIDVGGKKFGLQPLKLGLIAR